MFQLTITKQSQIMATVPLTIPRVTIGQDPANTVALDDARCCAFHAIIECRDGQWTCADAGSLHGTMVNGRRIKRISLQPGDRIAIGDHLLSFGVASQAKPAPAPAIQASPASISLEGELTLHSGEYLFRTVRASPGQTVVLDFSNVPRVTGDGWKLLLKSVKALGPATRVRFARMNGAVSTGFKVLGLNRLFESND